jgi:hypothetical protein
MMAGAMACAICKLVSDGREATQAEPQRFLDKKKSRVGGNSTIYVVILMFACVGVISNTPVNTVNAGSNIEAPNGEMSAEMETRKLIQLFIRGLNTL